jgi:DNA-binding NarL/FixJ family response regulator
MVRVLVADDHEPFLEAARAVVAATPGFELVGEARSGEEAVELAGSLAADLVLLDINMPGLGGIGAARQIAATRPETLAVLVSTYGAEELPAAARGCGARYLHKRHFGPSALAALTGRA